MSATILLVEDQEDNRTIYRTILAHAGYRVLEAVDGEAAVRTAREQRPDLVLMDISIPRLDGWEATRILREDPTTAQIPVVALTAHALAHDRARAAQLGYAAYLVKPIAPMAVVAEVQRLLEGRDGAAQADGNAVQPPGGGDGTA